MAIGGFDIVLCSSRGGSSMDMVGFEIVVCSSRWLWSGSGSFGYLWF